MTRRGPLKTLVIKEICYVDLYSYTYLAFMSDAKIQIILVYKLQFESFFLEIPNFWYEN